MMFVRLLWELLEGSRGRLMVALIAIVSGAAVISAMLGLQVDVESKLNEQFRMLGANIVISRGCNLNRAPGCSGRRRVRLVRRS